MYHLSRLKALIQLCPQAYQPVARELLSCIRAPEGSELLLAALTNTHAMLVRLVDDVQQPRLRALRDTCLACLETLWTDRTLSDEGYPNPTSIPADPAYKILARDTLSESPEFQALAASLLVTLLCPEPQENDISILVHALAHVPSIPGVPLPDSLVSRCLLLARYYALTSSRNADAAHIGPVIERHINALLDTHTNPERFRPSVNSVAALTQIFQADQAPAQDLTPTAQLRRKAAVLSVRIGAGIRHQHIPTIHRTATRPQWARLLQWLRHKDGDLHDWLGLHLLLSSHAVSVLGGHGSNRIFWSSTRDALTIRVPALELKRHDFSQCNGFEPVANQLTLPLPHELGRRIAAQGPPSTSHYHQQLQRFRDYCSRWQAQTGARVSLARAHRLLPLMFGEASSGDETLSHLLALKEVSRRDAGIHYFSPRITDIQKRYQDSLTQLAQALDLSEWLDDGWQQRETSGYAGASFRPALPALRNLVGHLRHMAALPRGKPTLENRLRAYNAEAACVTLMVLAATGARPVDLVVPPPAHWNLDSREILVSEKDSLLYRSTRKLPLPNRLIQARSNLTDRQQALALSFGKRFDTSLAVFLISPDGAAHAPTIPALKAHVPGFTERWPWPNDALRHYFRSRLWELGCPAHLLEVAMGHLGKSQTPDSPFAMRPISDSLEPLRAYLEPLLDELGF